YGPSGNKNIPYGIPWTIVTASTPVTPIKFQDPSQSNKVPYPLTATTPIEGGPHAGGDRHAIMVNSSTCVLYELWQAHYHATGSTAGSGATWTLTHARPPPRRVAPRRRRRPADPAAPGQLRRGEVGDVGSRYPGHSRLHPAVVSLAGSSRGGPSERRLPAHGRPIPSRRHLQPPGQRLLDLLSEGRHHH